MDTLRQDLRSGLRILIKSPGPAAAAALVPALRALRVDPVRVLRYE